jgi:glyoxylase-like metal-dependent hydrolase (beta-lactamase superfamily II)
VGEQVRRRILAELEDATDVAMSHLHGDHVPLLTTVSETLRTDPSSRKEDQHGDGLQIGTEMEQTLGGIRLTALASGTG